jgi:indolepyruvate ferredoxin oxidoreductase beta subunit
LIPEGAADVLLAFELAEAVRWLGFLSAEGRVIVNRQKLIPPIVSTGLATYPEEAEEILKREANEPIVVDALEIAQELGNARLVNTILLGVTAQLLELPVRTWRRVVSERVPQAFKDLNLKAFERGQALA